MIVSDETVVWAKNVGLSGGEEPIFQQVCGYAYQVDPINDPGALIVQFQGPPGEYNVIDTDYENFAAIYSCSQRGDNPPSLTAGIITRVENPDPLYVSIFI